MDIYPQDALVTEKRGIRATGLAKGPARFVATMEKPDGSFWSSAAFFAIGEEGALDLDSDAPVDGDWTGAEAMAFIWNMRQTRAPTAPEKSAGVEPIIVRCTLVDANGAVRRGEFIQRFLAPGVTVVDIARQGLAGMVFHPPGPGPHPVVIGLNGSNGGMPLQRCALYAAIGYTAVALAFFGAPGRPRYFGETPLEYFGGAFAWAKETLRPKDDFIAVAGASRGGELAFILAALFPEYVRATIAFVPSAVVNGVQQAGKPGEPRDAPAWFYKGEALPNLWQGNPDADVSAYTRPPAPGFPIRQDKAFAAAMHNADFLERSRIPVERAKGPVIMVSAEDDGCWPSEGFSEMIEERLAAFEHPWPVVHVSNKRAGHSLGFPYVPATAPVVAHPVSGLVMDFGGDAALNVRAGRDSWEKVMAFMRDAPAMYARGAKIRQRQRSKLSV